MVITRDIRFRLTGAEPEVRLQDHAIVVASGGKPRTVRHEVTFFDTSDVQLFRKGLALTLHREGKGWRQRLGGAPVLFGPGDDKKDKPWNRRQPDGILNVKKLKASGVGKRMLAKIRPESLTRLFSLEFERTTWRLDFPDGCRLLLHEEKGQQVTEQASTPFYDISMELVAGDESRLFQIALALLYHLSPRLETCSPERRAFLGLDAGLAQAFHQSLPALHPSQDAETAFARLASHLTNQIEGNLEILLYGGQNQRMDGLMEIAQAVDRCRSLLAFHDYLLPAIMRQELDEELEWLQHQLAPAKAWEEFFAGTLEPCIEQFPNYPALPELPPRVAARAREAYQRMEHAIVSFRCARLITGLRYWVGSQAWRELTDLPQKRQASRSITLVAKSALDRHHRQLIKLGEPALTGDNLENLHKLHQEGTTTLTAVEFFASLFNDRQAKAYHNALDWLMTGVRGLSRVEQGRAFFGQVIPADQDALIHLVNGWLGARREIFMLDTRDAWSAFSGRTEYWA